MSPRPPSRARHVRSRTASRSGFTLVEALVALLLLALGALGVASTSAWAARLASDARAVERQALAVQDAADSLRGVACLALVSGSVATPAGVTSWSATPYTVAAQLAVTAPAPLRRSLALSAELLVPCE